MAPNEGAEALVKVEADSIHPTEPLTSTFVAKAADVPIKVVTPSAIRAMAASLDLFDLVNILFSLSFLRLDSSRIISKLV
jgi:hypothetical protein